MEADRSQSVKLVFTSDQSPCYIPDCILPNWSLSFFIPWTNPNYRSDSSINYSC